MAFLGLVEYVLDPACQDELNAGQKPVRLPWPEAVR
jgi:hypothetical protein